MGVMEGFEFCGQPLGDGHPPFIVAGLCRIKAEPK